MLPYASDNPCRFFRDSGIVGTQHWYEAPPDAPVLEGWTAFGNSFWDYQGEDEYPIGGVRVHQPENTFATFPPGLKPDHVCGTPEDFAIGGIYDPTTPLVKIGSYGLPLCCNPPRRPRGGFAVGGISVPVVVPPISSRGGFGAGGDSSARVVGPQDIIEGGGEGGGEVEERNTSTDVIGGGGEGGGDVVEVNAGVDVIDGGGEGGGHVVETHNRVDVIDGGGEGGGDVVEVLDQVDVIDGGGEGGGDVVEVLDQVDVIGGGGEGGGDVVEVLDQVDQVAGGGAGGGAVVEVQRFTDVIGGGGQGGGLVVQVQRNVDVIVGGGAGGGLLIELQRSTDVIVGGGAGGGPVVEAGRSTDVIGGGGQGGGPVVESWSGGTPTPGNSCATAGNLSLGVSFNATIPVGMNAQWLKFPIVSGTLYHVRVSAAVNMTALVVEAGTSCSSLSLQFSLFANGCNTFTASVTGFGYLHWQDSFFSAGSFTVIADTGAC